MDKTSPLSTLLAARYGLERERPGPAGRGGPLDGSAVVSRRVGNSRSDYPPLASVDKAAQFPTPRFLGVLRELSF